MGKGKKWQNEKNEKRKLLIISTNYQMSEYQKLKIHFATMAASIAIKTEKSHFPSNNRRRFLTNLLQFLFNQNDTVFTYLTRRHPQIKIQLLRLALSLFLLLSPGSGLSSSPLVLYLTRWSVPLFIDPSCNFRSLMSALPNLPSITDALAATKGIFELIDRIPQIDSENANGKVLTNVRGQIEFREVHFSYPSRKDSFILRGFNMLVKPSMTVGLVGGSGSGKSTVISLLERFYDPVKGDILLDGHRIKKFQLKWLRSQMGLVNQQPILFATSIKENILFGKEDASMEQVISAAKAANAHDFIDKLPEGYETQVSHS